MSRHVPTSCLAKTSVWLFWLCPAPFRCCRSFALLGFLGVFDFLGSPPCCGRHVSPCPPHFMPCLDFRLASCSGWRLFGAFAGPLSFSGSSDSSVSLVPVLPCHALSCLAMSCLAFLWLRLTLCSDRRLWDVRGLSSFRASVWAILRVFPCHALPYLMVIRLPLWVSVSSFSAL